MTLKTPKRVRRTKVIATIGPSCDSEPVLREMIAAGMNVARLNMSHGDLDSHREKTQLIRRIADDMGANISVMVDTRGREIRTGSVEGGMVTLEREQNFILSGDSRDGTSEGVSITHPALYKHVSRGDRILLDDGHIELEVTSIVAGDVHCRVAYGGVLRDSKGVNLPDNTTVFDGIDPHISDLEFAAEIGAEYLAASFMRSAKDVDEVRYMLRAFGAEIPIIAKIESSSGVENLNSIVAAADGTMVARGDLGVEMGLASGPTIQKQIIRTTVSNGKPVITATEMLDSMERNPRPTRAEASDVANAIFDGTSAVMLSGETAVGAYPVEAIKTIVALSLEAEASLSEFGFLQQILPHPSNQVTEALAHASVTVSAHLNAAAIIALTETGFTPRLISKHRPRCPILAVTSSLAVVRKLSMNWGIEAVHYTGQGDDNEKLQFATSQAKAFGYGKSGDVVVSTAGSHSQAGSTDLIRVLSID